MFWSRRKKKENIIREPKFCDAFPNIDIRMEIVDEEMAINYLKSMEGTWIYIKNINDNFIDEVTREQVAIYTKFKVRNISEDSDTILIYGEEDSDILVFGKKYIVSYQMTPQMDELYVQIRTNRNDTSIYIKKYLPSLKNRLDEILESERNLIITEGKTDWKHLKNALAFFRSQHLYEDIKFDFFEFEDEIKMGKDRLMDILNYSKLFYSSGIKVFVFDSDTKEINEKHNGESFVSWGNNVFSFILPVPEFRKDTPFISIENYYTDEQIKTYDKEGHRLYINYEFDEKTGVLKSDPRIFYSQYRKIENGHPNHVIENNVYRVPENIEICSKNISRIISECTNIALSKNNFAENILKSREPFDNLISDHFSLVFDIIREIQNRKEIRITYEMSNQGENKEVKICDGIYIREYDNGLQSLEIHLDAVCYKKIRNEFYGVSVEKKENTFDIIINDSVKIPIPLTSQTWKFLQHKVDNCHNRVELHFHENESIRVVEILKDELAGAIIERELFRGKEG